MPRPVTTPSPDPTLQPATGHVRGRRADAQRNRDAIVEAARVTFETEGVLASLDGIAMRAGVGNATLYRNFPTRDDLLAAVLCDSIDAAVARARELSRTVIPRDALGVWLEELTWQLRLWHDLPHCLATAARSDGSPVRATVEPLQEEIERLLSEAAADVEDDVTAAEVLELVTTLSWGVDRYGDDHDGARRRVRRATAGLFRRPAREG